VPEDKLCVASIGTKRQETGPLRKRQHQPQPWRKTYEPKQLLQPLILFKMTAWSKVPIIRLERFFPLQKLASSDIGHDVQDLSVVDLNTDEPVTITVCDSPPYIPIF
jgi:hypothetical protein